MKRPTFKRRHQTSDAKWYHLHAIYFIKVDLSTISTSADCFLALKLLLPKINDDISSSLACNFSSHLQRHREWFKEKETDLKITIFYPALQLVED